jgi:hypothetical protein
MGDVFMSVTSKIIVSGLLIVFIIVTGIWLASMGRPLNTALFTVHKLIALGFVVFTSILIINLLKQTPMTPFVLVFIIIAVLSVIALFATGAMLSAEKAASKLLLTIHATAPAVMAIASAILLFLLTRKK